MKTMISESDTGQGSGRPRLRPDLYVADRVWLEREAIHEARRILAETEDRMPDMYYGPRALRLSSTLPDFRGLFNRDAERARRALAESLARFLDGGVA